MVPLTKREALERGQLSRMQHVLVIASTLAVALPGFALWWMRYFMEASGGDFSLYRHPSEPWWLAFHVLAAPLFLFALGHVFLNHARRHWEARLHRGSGALLLAAAAVMTWSGYALYFAGGEGMRAFCVDAHLASGAVFSLALVWHVAAGKRAKRMAAAESDSFRGNAG
jgi:hypothetical protein